MAVTKIRGQFLLGDSVYTDGRPLRPILNLILFVVYFSVFLMQIEGSLVFNRTPAFVTTRLLQCNLYIGTTLGTNTMCLYTQMVFGYRLNNMESIPLYIH